MYIAGTRDIADVMTDAHLVPQLLNRDFREPLRRTPRYRTAEQVLYDNPQVKTIVGHSLGGAISDTLADNDIRFYSRSYGAPLRQAGPRGQLMRHPYDPISVMNERARTTPYGLFASHSYRGYDPVKFPFTLMYGTF
jgi:hypothetical protein